MRATTLIACVCQAQADGFGLKDVPEDTARAPSVLVGADDDCRAPRFRRRDNCLHSDRNSTGGARSAENAPEYTVYRKQVPMLVPIGSSNGGEQNQGVRRTSSLA